MPVKRIALGIQYDSSAFSGWQTQSDEPTVQDVLERVLGKFTQPRVQTVVAGRTDTGVHALGQVVHFDTELERTDFAWVRGTNAFLPQSVAVQWARSMPEDFHARFGAFKRTLLLRAVRPPSPIADYHRPRRLMLRAARCQCNARKLLPA